jgi:hypothetical protein
MDDIVHHLVRGWQGFVRALLKATDAKVKFTPADLDLLQSMQAEMNELIRKQQRL